MSPPAPEVVSPLTGAVEVVLEVVSSSGGTFKLDPVVAGLEVFDSHPDSETARANTNNPKANFFIYFIIPKRGPELALEAGKASSGPLSLL